MRNDIIYVVVKMINGEIFGVSLKLSPSAACKELSEFTGKTIPDANAAGIDGILNHTKYYESTIIISEIEE